MQGDAIALYRVTIALYRVTIALYRVTIALYRVTIALYWVTIALYRVLPNLICHEKAYSILLLTSAFAFAKRL
jgi:hypothetical protein